MHTGVIRLALDMNIGLIVYGEDGELEYGGTKNKGKTFYDIEYIKNEMIEGDYYKIIKKSNLTKKDLYLLSFPSKKEMKNKKLKFTHWSYFENWNPYKNYMEAKKSSNLQEEKNSNTGTFTNFTKRSITICVAYVPNVSKIWFWKSYTRCWNRNPKRRTTRSQAINLVKIYDNQYDKNFLNNYLDYYEMNEISFNKIIEKWTNKKLFKKKKWLEAKVQNNLIMKNCWYYRLWHGEYYLNTKYIKLFRYKFKNCY